MTQDQLEEQADTIKLAIMKSLVSEGKFTDAEADEWCKYHTVIFRRKNIFQTISDLWKKEKESAGLYAIVVKQL